LFCFFLELGPCITPRANIFVILCHLRPFPGSPEPRRSLNRNSESPLSLRATTIATEQTHVILTPLGILANSTTFYQVSTKRTAADPTHLVAPNLSSPRTPSLLRAFRSWDRKIRKEMEELMQNPLLLLCSNPYPGGRSRSTCLDRKPQRL
jgi:hypothetical protein